MALEIDEEIAKQNPSTESVRIGRGASSVCAENVLVGNSFGGWVATLIALRSPARYRSLLLLAPGGTTGADEAGKDLFREPNVESLKDFQARAYFRPRELSDTEWKYAVRRLEGSGVGEIRSAQVAEDRLDGKLRELKVETTLVWGEADRILPRSTLQVFEKNVRGIRVRTLSECGHLPQKECPEKLAAVLRDAIP